MAEAAPAPAAGSDTPPPEVSAIQAMLDAEKGPAVEQTPIQEGEQPAEEAPPEENAVVEGEDAPADKPAMAEIPLDQLEAIELEITVKGEDGKDVVEKPTIKELRDGYMRQKDYSRKTAEVARQREEIGEKTRQAIEGERTTYQQTLQQLHNVVIEAIAPELANVNWNHLAANEPAEYVRLRNRADQIQQVLQGIQSKQQELATKQAAGKSQATQEAARKAVAQLEADIPGWSDDLYKTLMTAGQEYGFKPEEVGSWVDPRAIKLLHDANQFRQLQSGKTTAQKKVVTAPKVVKPGAAQTTTQSQARAGEAMKRLQSSGRVEDAAAVIRGRL